MTKIFSLSIALFLVALLASMAAFALPGRAQPSPQPAGSEATAADLSALLESAKSPDEMIALLLLLAALSSPDDTEAPFQETPPLSDEVGIVPHLSLDSPDDKGWTLLHHLAKEGNTHMVEVILNLGADIHAQTVNFMQYTPLHLAVVHEQRVTVALLLRRNADPNQSAWGKITPLHLAAGSGNILVTELLLEAEADLEACDFEDHTPLHWAAEKGRITVAQRLLQAGAHPDGILTQNKSPLHLATIGGHTGMVSLLLDAGADPNNGGLIGPPVYAAALHGHLEALLLLVAAGGDPYYHSEWSSTTTFDYMAGNSLAPFTDVIKQLYAGSKQAAIATN